MSLFECKRNRSSQLTMGVGVCMYDKNLKLSRGKGLGLSLGVESLREDDKEG